MSNFKICLIQRMYSSNPELAEHMDAVISNNSYSIRKASLELEALVPEFTGFRNLMRTLKDHKAGVCACSPTSALAALLQPTKSGTHVDAAPRGNFNNHPTGWEPRIKMDYSTGNPTDIISIAVPKDTPQNEALNETLSEMGVVLRDDQEAIVVEIRQGVDWFRGDQGEDAVSRPSTRIRWVVRFKETLGLNGPSEDELESLIKEANRISKKPRPVPAKTNRALNVLVADWQLGQADGEGLRAQVRRAAAIGPNMTAEIKRLSKAGTPVDSINIIGLGDLVEGCDGFYANQAFTVQADRREQVKLARRLLLKVVTAAAETGLPVIVTGVSGNHGENRQNGKAFTTENDNDDLAVIEQVYDIVEGRKGFENVNFSIPTDRLIATLNVNGHIMAYTHGHVLARGAGGASKKAESWWAKQALAFAPAGDAEILMAGHLHHLNITDIADNGTRGRLFVQAPAICDKSQHFSERYGMTSKAGLLTFTVAEGSEGADNFKVHKLDEEIEIDLAA